MEWLIGIDGGGSKTQALLADLQGNAVGRGEAGPSNYLTVGAAAAGEALEAAIQAAFASAGVLPSAPRALCLGLGGVDRPADLAVFHDWAAARYPDTRLRVVNDAHLVLAAGTPDGWGVAVISGTGAIVYGLDARGRTARALGWGYLLGDEGSGYAIGLAALQAVTHDADGRGFPTRLTGLLLEAWDLSAPAELVGRLYRPPMSPAEIASLALLVESAAGQGDAVAQEILNETGRALAEGVDAVARSLELTGNLPCALAGSLILKGQGTAAAFQRAAVELGLQLEPLARVPEPALGAIHLAKQSLA